MREYESFVYLDVQKTASSFISKRLKEHCRERCVRERKYNGIATDCDRPCRRGCKRFHIKNAPARTVANARLGLNEITGY
jgi:hypothetical protein